MSGIVYVLENECMPGIVKIGSTSNLTQRITDLSDPTGVPVPFTCAFAAMVENAEALERKLHTLFDEWRVSRKREFFRIKVSTVVAAFNFIPHEIITCDDGTPDPFEAGAKPGTAAYFLSRLDRERPDLATLVRSGEISVHAAAIQAGFRKSPVRLVSA